MAEPLDDRTPEQRDRQPTPETLAARRHEATGGGRLGRPRSWLTVAVGILALAVLATWFVITR